jgi:lysophospholipase L1-like esterase
MFLYYSVAINIIVFAVIGVYICGSMFRGNQSKDEFRWLTTSRNSLFEILPQSQNDIIFLGASIIQNCEWAELFSNANIKNRGISGDTPADVIERLGEVVRNRPDKVFVMIGLNDLFQDIPVNEIIRNYLKIVRYIRKQTAETRLHIFSLLPVGRDHGKSQMNSRILEVNVHLREICEKESCALIDLHPFFRDEKGSLRDEFSADGIHLNGAGYAKWRSVMAQSTGL